MLTGRTIEALYFGYQPAAGHLDGCPRRGSDTWDVTRYTRLSFDGQARETVLRLACGQCGVLHFCSFDGESTETTHASVLGFGRKPEKVAGLWLHAGPPLWYGDDRGPLSWYVTVTRDRPQRPEDVAGVVGWSTGPRGGIRWRAGIGVTEYGNAREAAGQDFASRRAAVAWIAARVNPGEVKP